MARNKVQFQRGLSEAQFAARYGTEDQCREAVMCLALAIRLRLPGLRREASQRHQDPRALPVYRLSATDILDCWNDFRRDQGAAVYLVSRHVPPHPEQGRHLSSIELGRRLCVTQTTAWKIKHKLMQVMMERDAVK